MTGIYIFLFVCYNFLINVQYTPPPMPEDLVVNAKPPTLFETCTVCPLI